jgi:signal transduction histidine kinase
MSPDHRKTTQENRNDDRRISRLKSDTELHPKSGPDKHDLSAIIDVPSLQSLMEKFFALTHMGIGIIDLKGNILVEVGWQNACTKFHRLNPDSKRNCQESDIVLSKGVQPGEFREYKCKNHMWDIVTPLFIDKRHVGNIFFGQYFYTDENIDKEIFVAQAEKYGFDKDSYLAAIKNVQRFSREEIRNLMTFFAELAGAISRLSYSNLKLAQTLVERKQAEESLKRYTSDLEETIEELESFSYSVSHDLRQPLRAIDGFSQAVIEDYGDRLDEQGKDYLKRVRQSALLMSQLIDDILNLARVTRIPMNWQKVDLSELVKSITQELLAIQPERKIQFTIAPGVITNGDKRLLEIMLRNILENAWKFTGKQEHPEIQFGTSKQNGNQVCFIQDNGAGFDMRYVDKLFKPFQRLHRETDFPGTGIGLATAQRIIHRHGGRIWAESEPGKGTTIYFTYDPETS